MESECENMSVNIENLPLTIDENNIVDGAREVLRVIRPLWSYDNIKFKVWNLYYKIDSLFLC